MEDGGRLTVSSDFGNLLRRHRLAAGLSQEALAERARMSSDGVSALERGHRRAPQRETLALLVGALALDGESRAQFEAAARSGPGHRIGASVTTGPWSDARAAPLPLSLTSFVGRDAELAELAALVGSHRFVTITGAGGIGKTQTALRVAAALEDSGGGTTVFVPLAPVAKASNVVSAIAAALGVQELAQRPLLDTVQAFLRRKKLLLVLDNAEHLIEQAARVAETLLQGVPELRILATSRTAFNVGGEHVYRLPSLALDRAVELFVDRAKAVDFHFEVTERNAGAVASLCERLDGIPLAIELAAARVESLPVEEISKHFDGRLHLLAGGSRTSASRQQTMRATIEWSYNLLSESERRVFERLSIFAGGGTLASAATVCAADDIAEAEVADLIASLVMASLLVADLARAEPRYRLLEPFRQYARERLAARGDDGATAHRHARACLESARRFENAWENEPKSVDRQAAESELDDWRSALDWTLTKRQNVLLGQEIAGRLGRPCLLSGRFIEGRDWTHLALELTDESTPQRVVADLACTCALIAVHLDAEEAISAGNRALTLYAEIGDRVSLALMQIVVGTAYVDLGDRRKGKALVADGLALSREVKSPYNTTFALRMLAVEEARDGDETGARRDALEAKRIAQERGGYHEILQSLSALGASCSHDPELALQYLMGTLTEAFAFPTRLDVLALSLERVSAISLLLERYDQALARAQEVLDLDGLHDRPGFTYNALTIIAIVVSLQAQATGGGEAAKSAHAARLLGITSDRPCSGGSGGEVPWLRQIVLDARDVALVLLADAIGRPRLEELMAEGSAMTREQAIVAAMQLCR